MPRRRTGSAPARARKVAAFADAPCARCTRPTAAFGNASSRSWRSPVIEGALRQESTDEARARIENIREFFGVVQEFDETHEDAGFDDFLEWVALRTDLDADRGRASTRSRS